MIRSVAARKTSRVASIFRLYGGHCTRSSPRQSLSSLASPRPMRQQIFPIQVTQGMALNNRINLPSRSFASLSEADIKKRLDEFQDLFVEARLCIEDVVESEGTKYFDEDAEAAQEAVGEAVESFEKLIEEIDNADEKNRVLRGNGLKVEQLKGELKLALKGGHDH